MFSIKYGNNQPKLSHYIRALASPARNECSTKEVILMQHQKKCKENVSNSPTSIGKYYSFQYFRRTVNK